MRALMLLVSLIALVGAAPIDYGRRVAATPEGGFVIGNPAAKVRLVEYGSLTCPHCRDFHLSATTPLTRDYVAKGQVAYEYRSLILNGPDLAASTLARCDGAPRFFSRVGAFYRDQPRWTAAFGKVDEAAQKRVEGAPEGQKLLVLAQVGGLDRYATSIGIPAARVRQCLTDKAVVDRLVAMTQAAGQRGVQGTPTFYLNDERLDTNVWTQIEPLLRGKLGLK